MRFGHTARIGSGVPLLSCALVVLLPVPAVAVSGPGSRPPSQAVSSPVPHGGASYPGLPGANGTDSEAGAHAGRTVGAFAEPTRHAPHHGRRPLPPLFGHASPGAPDRPRHPEVPAHAAHRDHTGAHRGHTGAESESAASGDRTGQEPAAEADDAGRGSAGPGPRTTAPRTDARDGSGGDADPTPAPGPQNGAPGEADQAQPWSPAPVAPQDAERTAGADAPGTRDTGDATADTVAGTSDTAVDTAAPAAAQAPAGPMLPVLPLGAGLASLGLGLAFLALRMRRG